MWLTPRMLFVGLFAILGEEVVSTSALLPFLSQIASRYMLVRE